MDTTDKVILIMTDTQRWDMCGCYRDTGLRTPNIDRLASGGVRFERAYTTQPVCQPARAALFTGMYPHSCAGWANNMGISDTTRSIGRRLTDAGVKAAYIGKWHLDGSDYFGDGKCADGWDAGYWYDMRNYLEELPEEDRRRSRKPESMLRWDFEPGFTYGRRCADRAIDFLRNERGRFFLALSFDEPHGPFLCPQPYASMYKGYAFPRSGNLDDDLLGKPDYQRVWAKQAEAADKAKTAMDREFFFGCNSFVDGEVGRVLDAARELAPDALIIYTSDHGDFLSSHRLSGKGPAVYDEVARVPLIVAGAGVRGGAVCPNPVSHINIAPTIFEAMGLAVPEAMEGPSLVPELSGSGRRVNGHVFIEFGRFEVPNDGFGGFQPLRAAFDGRYKLSVNLLSTDELYDIESDPGEMVNLIGSEAHAAIRDGLHDAILRHMDDTWDPFRGYYWERRPWRADAREASWGHTGKARYRGDDGEYSRRQIDYPTGMPASELIRQDQ